MIPFQITIYRMKEVLLIFFLFQIGLVSAQDRTWAGATGGGDGTSWDDADNWNPAGEPAAGEIVIYDRSWYNRGGVEKVMGFCTQKQYVNFLQTCPEFERMVISSGSQLIKYWFSVSAEEQMKRFKARAADPTKGWKLSPMDLESVNRWDDYSKAKDNMFEHTDTQASPWFVVESDNKKKARLNCISHLLDLIDYHEIEHPEVIMPDRVQQQNYERPPRSSYNYVPEVI